MATTLTGMMAERKKSMKIRRENLLRRKLFSSEINLQASVILGQTYEPTIVRTNDIILADRGCKRQLAIAILALAVKIVVGVDRVQVFILTQVALAFQSGTIDSQVLIGVIPGIEESIEADLGKRVRKTVV